MHDDKLIYELIIINKTLKAISSTSDDSKLIWDYASALNEVNTQRNLTLPWVPGYSGMRRNEAADPFFGITKS